MSWEKCSNGRRDAGGKHREYRCQHFRITSIFCCHLGAKMACDKLRKKCHEFDGMGLMNDNDWLFHSYGVFESSDDAHFLLSNIKTERSVDIPPE